uniref:ATP synthase complex subunit 8 n=1 Tax=Scriptaphyosemion bertholdi TaxID=60397 RepID=A0A517U6X5_9TELE|nr:ATP synthase F0 subunit 8 [Scriptaphyosemion bertholdi]QDT76382.1 ATP synthase F0 subunit 8 [Scriptaphyosemion bertholdi]
MPQLDPAPWFYILVISWLVFITFIPSKVLAHQVHNDPNAQSTEKPMTNPWNWPW